MRAGSTKQVGSASGEGIAALLSVRRWLEDHHEMMAEATDDPDPVDEPAA